MTHRYVPALLLVVTAGCADADADAAPEAVVRDSAGVVIVENPIPPDSGGALVLAAEPELVIGVLEGAPEYQLYQAGPAIRLSDGRIVIPNEGSHEVRYYEADGSFIRSTGGEGDGPGEFRALSWAHRLAGDSLLVYDGRNRRLTVLDPAGEFVRAIAVDADARFPFPQGMVDDEHVLFTANRGFAAMGSAPEGVIRDTVEVFVTDWRAGAALDEPDFAVPGGQLFLSRGGNEGNTWMSIQPVLLTSFAQLDAHEGRIYNRQTSGYRIDVLRPDGTLGRIVRRAYEPVAVTSAMRDEYVERDLEEIEDENRRRRERDIYGDMPVPDYLPAVGGMRVDAPGRIWVSRYRIDGGDAPTISDVYDPDGRWIAAVHLPPRFRPTEIGVDYVLGIARDEFDVEQVRLYRLIAGGDGSGEGE